ncbi:MAG: hypothetical protein J6R41_03035 [Paludibacteraceae bacterium]|nr:hypothetical protein [Paludibacteraceae bacterium]
MELDYKSRIKCLIKSRARFIHVSVWIYYILYSLPVFYASYSIYPEVGILRSILLAVLPIIMIIGVTFIPIFIESKYFLIDVSENDDIVLLEYLRYDKRMIFKTSKNLLRYSIEDENTIGIYIDASVILYTKTEKGFFKKCLRFYSVGKWSKDLLEKSFRDKIKKKRNL